jgi:glycosyltransferase involved in cell wall biosynthesis
MALKVLHLIQGKHFGGAEQVVLSISKSFDPRLVSSSVCCLSNGLLLKKLRDYDIPAYIIPMRSEIDIAVPLIKFIKLAISSKINIIHTHSVRSNLIGRLSAFFVQKKCVTHLHSPVLRDFADFKRGRRNEFIDSLTRPIANHYIAVSHSLRREQITRGMDPTKITTIHNGFDLDNFNIEASQNHRYSSIKKEYGLPDDAILLVLVALIRPRKGVEVIIRAVNNLKNRFPKVFLVIVGDDNISEDPLYGRKLRELVSTLEIESRVIFTGFREDVISILKQSDLMILPSLFGEGSPMVILEAMAMGLPAIASDIEGVPEIVCDGVNGFLVKPGDADGLSDKIISVLSREDLLETVKNNAMQTIKKKFNSKIQAKKIESIYKKVIGY